MTEAESTGIPSGREPARTEPALQQRWTGTSLCSALGTRTGHAHPAGQAEGGGRRKHNPQGLALLGLVHSTTWGSWAVTSQFSRIALSDHEHHMTETENYKQYLLPISQHKNLCRLGHKIQRLKWVEKRKHKFRVMVTLGRGEGVCNFHCIGN